MCFSWHRLGIIYIQLYTMFQPFTYIQCFNLVKEPRLLVNTRKPPDLRIGIVLKSGGKGNAKN